MFRDDK